ncbi:forespore capture DNA-binding protein RefZ [Jeotgalibacillus sp. R-1-5s-1]|uniref:forespore capture DNA-binding protein RefZ n=1 Tax=Jeotgalibacillus sp. R-1-5s-1 TaxID=2555897 RepID=UPI00106969CC|nr:forespore capture DNA-binding protein RefZ [Jeotgalibacillus sp. R-1-5s-1]TFD98209.1 TetR/AcrR family transcriptional regulator [Jeotgalibacillus sp. R-1-5s-1]
MAVLQRETKSEVMTAAVDLFYTKGFHATSVREISAAAEVNVATVSYYFSGKKGLLEECLIAFFEPYLAVLEGSLDLRGEKSFVMAAARRAVLFQQQHHRFARFAWREITMDNQLIREMTASYLRKEQYLWKMMMAEDIERGISFKLPPSFFLIQLSSMITAPFLQGQSVRELWNVHTSETYFSERYMDAMDKWFMSVTSCYGLSAIS